MRRYNKIISLRITPKINRMLKELEEGFGISRSKALRIAFIKLWKERLGNNKKEVKQKCHEQTLKI